MEGVRGCYLEFAKCDPPSVEENKLPSRATQPSLQRAPVTETSPSLFTETSETAGLPFSQLSAGPGGRRGL